MPRRGSDKRSDPRPADCMVEEIHSASEFQCQVRAVVQHPEVKVAYRNRDVGMGIGGAAAHRIPFGSCVVLTFRYAANNSDHVAPSFL